MKDIMVRILIEVKKYCIESFINSIFNIGTWVVRLCFIIFLDCLKLIESFHFLAKNKTSNGTHFIISFTLFILSPSLSYFI